jgi:hypothetical protein
MRVSMPDRNLKTLVGRSDNKEKSKTNTLREKKSKMWTPIAMV